ASYVYFPTKETVLTIGSTVVSEEEILEIANSFHWKDESQISNINNNLNSSTNDEWITFTADEIDLRLSYPGNWKKYYDYSEDYGFTLELESNIQVYNVDPLTNQGAEGPLIEFRVNSQPNFENYVLSDWVSHSSAVEDEQERIRKDIQGYMGYTQWIWHQSNPFAFSSINYYVDVNDEIWEFRASINDDNPESEQFIKSKKIIEQIFESIEFTD
ncbi:hypothetical protein KJ810_01375, partial [Patescibacteria group bacterium]|nr:hypothetical protein [Patescibacteria group bacterium]